MADAVLGLSKTHIVMFPFKLQVFEGVVVLRFMVIFEGLKAFFQTLTLEKDGAIGGTVTLYGFTPDKRLRYDAAGYMLLGVKGFLL